MMAAVTLVAAVVPPASMSAAQPFQERPKPAARVQVILKSIYIYNDRDPGDGEFNFSATLMCYGVATPCFGEPQAGLDTYNHRFSAPSTSTYTLNKVLPVATATNPQYEATADTGYPLYPGQVYQLTFSMYEEDWFTAYDLMGTRHIMLTKENGWAIGTYELQSTDVNRWGDYKVEFEVRAVPLPDLQPVDIKVNDVPGSTKKRICAGIQNSGPLDAGPFDYWLFVDGQVRPEAAGNSSGLRSIGYADVCGGAAISLPPGPHQISAVVNPTTGVIESNETNNTYQRSYTAAALSSSGPTTSEGGPASTDDASGTPASPTSQPSQSQPDLTISAIKVNGQAPDGKNDCKDGKNAVVVAVKNAGAEEAKSVSVRLVVDDAQGAAIEQSVASLAAGQEREVRFEDVRLKKGEHQIAASVAGKNKGGDATADNNELKVTARCQEAA
jgi:hypothetical protein